VRREGHRDKAKTAEHKAQCPAADTLNPMVRVSLCSLQPRRSRCRNSAVIDTDKLIADAKKLDAYCASNPTIGLITATDKPFGGD